MAEENPRMILKGRCFRCGGQTFANGNEARDSKCDTDGCDAVVWVKPDNVTEIPAGDNDAGRILRFALRQFENGELEDVIIICSKKNKGGPWVNWSDMTRWNILWYTRWLNRYIENRYFPMDEEEREE